jgi:hypothetical protein
VIEACGCAVAYRKPSASPWRKSWIPAPSIRPT